MKITVFTSNKPRHNYLINFLAKNCKKLFVIQECSTIFPGYLNGIYPMGTQMRKYFKNVHLAEKKIFGNQKISGKNINIFPIQAGDLNLIKLKDINSFLQSDLYIVFGSSYIKGNLVNFLIKKKAINIHMGTSPYYRGTDCNFWAMQDNNPQLVGATIHFLSKGLDSGKMIANAISEEYRNPFIYTMSTVKSAFFLIRKLINDKNFKNIKGVKQNKELEIRYSRKSEFNENIIKLFFKKKKKILIKKKYLLINTFKLKKDKFFL